VITSEGVGIADADDDTGATGELDEPAGVLELDGLEDTAGLDT
jgi:hypothetical protein